MPVNYFLKLDGVQGDSAVEGHKYELEVLSWGWGLTNSSANLAPGSNVARKPSFQDFNFSVKASVASPMLFLACADGRQLDTADLTGVSVEGGSAQKPFLTMHFQKAKVTGFKSGAETGSQPEDEVSISFLHVELILGPNQHTWDLDVNHGS